MSPEIWELFEKNTTKEIILFGYSNLKYPQNGIITQYDWAYNIAITANHKTDLDVVCNIIHLLEIAFYGMPTIKQKLKSILLKITMYRI